MNTKSCGCPTIILPKPILPSTCKKPKPIAHIEGKGEYEVHTLVNTDNGEAFLPVTSTSAVYDDCGNNLDSILKAFSDQLAEFNKVNLQFLDCNGNVHNLEMVLNCNVRVVDNFTTDSGAKALSARRGKYLFDALNNLKSDVHLVDAEDGTTAVKIREGSVLDANTLRGLLNDMKAIINLYTEYSDVLFNLLSTIVKPNLKATTSGVSSRYILRRDLIVSGAWTYCVLQFIWDLDTDKPEIFQKLTDILMNVNWYDSSNNLLDTLIIGKGYVTIQDKGNASSIRTRVPDNAVYCKLTVTLHYGDLKLTSDPVTYHLVEAYSLLEDFRLIGVDHIQGIDEGDDIGAKSKIIDGLIYKLTEYGDWEIENIAKMDTLYYSFKLMYAMGKQVVDEEVPLYYYHLGEMVQINKA